MLKRPWSIILLIYLIFKTGLALATPPESWSEEEANTCNALIREREGKFESLRSKISEKKSALDKKLNVTVEDQVKQLESVLELFSSKENAEKIKEFNKRFKDRMVLKKDDPTLINDFKKYFIDTFTNANLEYDSLQCSEKDSPQKSFSGFAGSLFEYALFGVEMDVCGKCNVSSKESNPASLVLLMPETKCGIYSRVVSFGYDNQGHIYFLAGSYDQSLELPIESFSSIDLSSEPKQIKGNTVLTSILNPIIPAFSNDTALAYDNRKSEFIGNLDLHAMYASLLCGTYYKKSLILTEEKSTTITDKTAIKEIEFKKIKSGPSKKRQDTLK